ncbi:MAG: hypothetical protein U5L45_25990 [Saprospiraceae bacterium]|nr:hypothetical protein [Saprospiraceae bacterium]
MVHFSDFAQKTNHLSIFCNREASACSIYNYLLNPNTLKYTDDEFFKKTQSLGCLFYITCLCCPVHKPRKSVVVSLFRFGFSVVAAGECYFYPYLVGESDKVLVVFNRHFIGGLGALNRRFWRQFLEKY